MNDRTPLFNGASYGARTLGWSGKRDVSATTTGSAAQQQPWWAREQALPQALSAQPVQQVSRPFAPQAPPPSTPLPQNLYDAPSPPVQSASASPAAPPQFQPGQVGARTYSVGRQFGMSPDPIPAAGPSRMVLIAPPPAAEDEADKSPAQEGGEWSGRAEKDGDL
jgi:hypothetical protein